MIITISAKLLIVTVLLYKCSFCIAQKAADPRCFERPCVIDIDEVYSIIEHDTKPGYVFDSFCVEGVITFKPTLHSEGYLRLVVNNTYSPPHYYIVQNKNIDAEQFDVNNGVMSSITYYLECKPTVIIPGSIGRTVKVVIKVTDINDHAPTFGHLFQPDINVPETFPVGEVVHTLQGMALDADAINNMVYYSLTPLDDTSVGMFTIKSPHIGDIILLKPLDYDNGTRLFTYNVTASDNGSPFKMSTAVIHIHINDSDDRDPLFTQVTYSISIPEEDSSLLNTRLDINPPISARDQDLAINQPILYSFAESDVDLPFTIGTDRNKGVATLRLTSLLDRERTPHYSFNVRGCQSDASIKCAVAQVNVIVSDVNDHPPVMSRTDYNASVPENLPVGSFVTQVLASDNDQGQNAVIQYIMIGNDEDVFSVDSSTGRISVRNQQLLDRERRHTYQLQVYATETETVEKRKSAAMSRVTITVLDENDNSPLFHLSTTNFSVAENASLGHVITRLYANDSDSGPNSRIHYSLQPSFTDLQRFTVHSETGELTVSSDLSQPYQKFYQLLVIAQDQPLDLSMSRHTAVVITVKVTDINNHPPVFLKPDGDIINLRESTVYNTSIYKFEVRDMDREDSLVCSISPRSTQFYTKFEINSCVVHLRGMLDYETNKQHIVAVHISDGIYNNTAHLYVLVTDENDHSPKFTSDLYVFNISEGVPARTFIGQVQAFDDDDGLMGEVQYNLPDVWQSTVFLSNLHGNLSTFSEFDAERDDSITMMVEARDKGTPPRVSMATIVIYIADINDNRPMFSDATVSIVLEDGTEPRHFYTVQATDRDRTAANRVTRYTIQSGDTSLFSLDPLNGSLSVIQTIDLDSRSTLSSYTLVVEASNVVPFEGKSRGTSRLTVLIKIKDKNDKPPVFLKPSYNFSVYENSPIGTVVGRIETKDGDFSSQFQRTAYSIVSGGTAASLFAVNSLGEIILNGHVDHDPPISHKRFDLIVKAADSQTGEYQTANVTVTVLDDNDNHPVFSNETYFWDIKENDKTSQLRVRATDADSGDNGRIVYSISLPTGLNTHQSHPFTIDSNTGVVSLSEPVDYEKHSHFYAVTLVATDNGKQPLIGLAILKVSVENVNDNRPQFTHATYNVTLSENDAPDTLVYSMAATDRDGPKWPLVYRLSPAQSDFRIDVNSGDLTTTRTLDYEATQSYDVRVVVTDGEFTSDAHVYVTIEDANDNAPVFTRMVYQVSVIENVTLPKLIQVTADDDDYGSNADITYAIISGNAGRYFSIDGQTGQVGIVRPLDYEKQTIHQLLVAAYDGGSVRQTGIATVSVNVTDVNDEPPSFTRRVYTADIQEGVARQSLVLQVTASDADTPVDHLTYKVLKSDQFVFIGQKLVTNGDIDRETASHILLDISAFDGQAHAYSMVNISIIDINDNVPEFIGQMEIDIIETLAIGSVIHIMSASDKDISNTGFTFWLQDSNLFRIDPQNGSLSVSGRLSALRQTQHKLNVYVSDHGVPPLLANVQFIVNVLSSNVYRPVFNSLPSVVRVPESTETDVVILTVTATDKDKTGNNVTYALLSGNHYGFFKIHHKTGSISLNKTLDYESSIKSFKLTIEATDSGWDRKSQSTVLHVEVLDSNDHSPEFAKGTPTRLIVNNDTVVGSSVLSVTATDADSGDNGHVSYSLSHGLTPDVFRVNASSGVVSVAKKLVVSEFTLQITASDHGSEPRTTTWNMTVLITQKALPMFSPPSYTKNIPENSPAGTFIVDLNATVGDLGPDQQLTYFIQSHRYSALFKIHPFQGVLKTSMVIDRDALFTQCVNLTVTATVTVNSVVHHLNKTDAKVKVCVLDENDSAPTFSQTEYHITVLENITVGAVVTTVSANDRDLTSHLRYSIGSDNAGKLFTIHQDSGRIRTSDIIDYDTMDPSLEYTYTLTVSVTDKRYTASVPVYIHISDVNDNLPQCSQSVYLAKVPENAENVRVTKVTGQDGDIMDRGKLTYSISHGNDGQHFSMDIQNGLIVVVKALDREMDSRYVLNITVMDTARNQALCQVTVEVLDVNDNSPRFLKHLPSRTILEGEDSRSLSVPLSATDPDLGPNAVINYTLHNNYGYFHLKATTSSVALKVIRPIDREMHASSGQLHFPIIVVATDNGVESRSTSTTVHIYVDDINDNSPVCSDPLNVVITEETPYIEHIGSLAATDSDTGPNALLSYSIILGDPDSYFRIQEDGRLYVGRDVDREIVARFNLLVLVEDGGETRLNCTTTANVTVLDINDNAPVFTQPSSNHSHYDGYHFFVNETIEAGALIGEVMATDADAGANGQVFFKLLVNHPQFYLTSDGRLYCASSLDFEDQSLYNIMVVAFDGGTPSLSSRVSVRVNVTDVFESGTWQSAVVLFIDSFTPIGSIITRFAKDGDVSFTYNITDGNEEGVYELNEFGDLLLVKKPNNTLKYNLTLEITETSYPFLVYYKTVLIYIRDLAVRKVYTTYQENKAPGQMIIDISIPEETKNESVLYGLTQVSLDNYPGIFNISHDSGELFCLVSLDREKQNKYELEVVYSVTARRHKRAFGESQGEILVTVLVGDENDNKPQFTTTRRVYGIPGDSGFNYPVAEIHAEDRDAGVNAAIAYSITAGDDNVFHIDAATGKLFTTSEVAKIGRTEFSVTVTATDRNGFGLSTSEVFKIVAVSDRDRAVLLVQLPPAVVRENLQALLGNLSAIIGYHVEHEKVVPHAKSGGGVEHDRSDLYIHAINITTGKIVSKENLLRKLQENDAKIRDMFSRFRIEQLDHLWVQHPLYVMSEAEIALLSLAAIIFIGSLICIIVLSVFWRQHEVELYREKMAMKAREAASNAGEMNHGFEDTTIDTTDAQALMHDLGQEGCSNKWEDKGRPLYLDPLSNRTLYKSCYLRFPRVKLGSGSVPIDTLPLDYYSKNRSIHVSDIETDHLMAHGKGRKHHGDDYGMRVTQVSVHDDKITSEQFRNVAQEGGRVRTVGECDDHSVSEFNEPIHYGDRGLSIKRNARYGNRMYLDNDDEEGETSENGCLSVGAVTRPKMYRYTDAVTRL